MSTVCGICHRRLPRAAKRSPTRYRAVDGQGQVLPGLFTYDGFGAASCGSVSVICGDLHRHHVENGWEKDSGAAYVQLVHVCHRLPVDLVAWWHQRVPLLHVVTWNVLAPTWVPCRRHRDYGSGTCETQQQSHIRLKKIESRLHTLHADVYLLQEIDDIVWQYLTQPLYQDTFYLHWTCHDAHHWAGSGQQTPPPSNGNAVMIRKTAVQTQPTYQSIPLSENGNRALETYMHLCSGHTCSFLNVHLEDVDQEVRLRQYHDIQTWRQRQSADVHGVGGDFNDAQASKRMRGFGAHCHTTYSDPHGQDPEEAIDYIFMSPALPQTYFSQCVHTQQQPLDTWGSDHVPVSLWWRRS
jgi:endonuclease/exonuclease/phosphatase family metal-dependent hydrolase